MPIDPQDYEALRRYLLGELPEREADRLEPRLLAEHDLFELALAVEEELIEQADRGELRPEQRDRVLSHVPLARLSQWRAFQRVLEQVASEQSVRDPLPLPVFPPPPPPPSPGPGWRRRPELAALAAGLAAAMIAIPLLVAHRIGASKVAPVAPAQRLAEWVETASPGHAKAPPAPPDDRWISASRETPVPPPPPRVMPQVFDLALAVLRSGEALVPELRVDPARPVELRVLLGARDDSASFFVTLAPLGGEPVVKRELRAGDHGGTVTIPLAAGRLATGRYSLSVGEEGDPEKIGSREIDVVVQ